jgi:hypothetical protein
MPHENQGDFRGAGLALQGAMANSGWSSGVLASTVAAGVLLLSHGAGAQEDAEGVAVEYQVPAAAPTGDVQVLSFGAADLAVDSTIGNERFVHLRLAAVNREDPFDWVVDARDQVVTLSDGTQVAARYAMAGESDDDPLLTLRSGERGFLDLFFPSGSTDPEAVTLRWMVRRGDEVLTGVTVFEALLAPSSDYGHYWPSQYLGGSLLFGPLWCQPHWPGRGWLRHYGGYGHYRYTRQPGGFDVVEGDRAWRYRRDEHPAPQDTVAARWRRQGPTGGANRAAPLGQPQWETHGTAAPTSAAPATAPTPAPSWHVTFQPGRRDLENARSTSVGPGRTQWYAPARSSPSTSWGGAAAAVSSSSSSSSTSSSSSSSSTTHAAPASPPSSVGGHWRSR